jgi:hypothetical protein
MVLSQERERLVFSNKRASMASNAEVQGYKVSLLSWLQ